DALTVSPDGRSVAAAVMNQNLRWWDAATDREMGRWMPRDLYVACLAWSPDGTFLAAGGGTLDPTAKRVEGYKQTGHDLRFFVLGRRQGFFVRRGDGPTLTALAFSRDGQRLATGGQAGAVRVW